MDRKENYSNIVTCLIRGFEQNSVDSTIKRDKISEKDLNCIKSGSVKNAFDLLMLRRGVDTPLKTQRRSMKGLEKKKIASD